MSKKNEFPMLIHVTHEGEGDDAWLQVNPGGVFDLTESNQAVAIYQRVDVGRVEITKRFVGRSK